MAQLQDLFTKIDSLHGQLEKLKPLKREDEERLWKKFRLEWNYNSNHIEGNTLTYGQTELLIFFGKTTGDHDIREYREMQAHDVALKMIVEYANDKSREIIEADIRELNKVILVEPYWGNAQTADGQPTKKLITPGEYKKEPNSVLLQNGEMFHYASPEDTPIMMKELLEWYADAVKQKKLHPVEIAALIHYKFVCIHPFDDSNGRTSRLLMNYVLLRYGYPPVIIKSADKKNYLNALNKADVGDVNAFVEYISEHLIWSLEVSLKAGAGESIEELDDVDKEIDLFKRKSQKKLKEAIPKSAAVLKELVDSSLVQLFTTLFEDQSKLNIFFDKNFTSVEFDHTHQSIAGIGEFSVFLHKVIDERAAGFSNSSQTNLSIRFYKENLKLASKEYYANKSIDIKLNGLNYEIDFIGLKRKYPLQLTKEEIVGISKKILAQFFKEIKLHSDGE
jgi:Fic family protein